MVEVRYVRWRAMALVALGLAICLMALYVTFPVTSDSLLLLLFGLFFGGVIGHWGRLRLQEKDILLRLTPEKVWTKELGWQPWEKLEVKRYRTRQGLILEIHRCEEPMPRFLEIVSSLTIHEDDLAEWISRYSVRL